MSRNVKTARGQSLDMSALATKHEMTRAVGNVPMNARGDRINNDGSVKVTAEEIAVAHQNIVTPPQTQPISDTKPIEEKAPAPKAEPVAPTPPPEVTVPNLEEQFSQEPEAISKITRTRDDGTKYVEIDYDDGSIETLEINEEE